MQRSAFVRLRRARPLRRLAFAALLSLLAPAAAIAAGNGKLQIHHIDVGQGDGMLLISPLGQTALFDDGNYIDCSGIKTYLQGLGITTIDYHFCSHYHADHIGCIDDLAAIGITIGTTGYDRGYSYSSATYTAYVNTLGAKRTTVAKGQTITLDAGSPNPVTITCVDLNGAGVYSVNGSDENAKSAVFKVSYGAFDESIGGDLTGSTASGNDVETTVGPEMGDVEVYKVHHHGSRYSSNDNWLNAVTPEVAIIQVGDGNTYGHPTADALSRLHGHGVHTYWNETGAGVAPDPGWDKVGGTIVVQAVPDSGGTYTVAGTGFTDSYTNGGGPPPPPPPPLSETLAASSVAMLKGTITGGSVASLAANDASSMTVTAARTGSKYSTDWYGEVTLNHPPTRLTVTYDGSFSTSRTQTLYLWNWTTSAWVQVDQATVGSSDVTRSWTTTSPGAYVSASRQVRLRVLGNNRNSSYTCRGDYMAFSYDYLQGTAAVQALAVLTGTPAAGELSGAPDLETEAMHRLPQSVLSRIEAVPTGCAVSLTWATDRNAHMDGFNVYRETADGVREFVGNEALLEVDAAEAVYRYVDESPAAGGVYWLGARSCAGPEGLIGPIRAAARPAAATGLSLAASPNPARGTTQFRFGVGGAGLVRLDVFDLAGRRIATPFSGYATPGPVTVEWKLEGPAGSRVEPGIYFARLQSPGRTLYTRVTVIER
jgi:beta-lactamase superfamily II metal-dependent hydrolase